MRRLVFLSIIFLLFSNLAVKAQSAEKSLSPAFATSALAAKNQIGNIKAAPVVPDHPTLDESPLKNMVTLIEFGADYCPPCQTMAPVIKELKELYKGKAAVVYLDIKKDKASAKRFRVRAIPTLIMFDREGKEVGRHEGMLSKEKIMEAFARLDIKP